jgi:hypothetical protein
MAVGLQISIENKNYKDHEKVMSRPVFYSHEEYSGRAKQSFDSFCKKNPISTRYLLPPYYEDDQKYVGLQVADNLAFETRKLVLSERNNRKERVSMTRLKESGSIFQIYNLDYKSLKIIADAQAPDFNPLNPLTYSLADIIKGS